MHLKSIRARGFKSFPDPVELRLEPGVTVVVGPNGSGKSNVADAIVWAAGSLSPSELRAEKPDDVLFAGGRGREPAGFCEVELVFDTDGGTGELPYAELSIARRLHRGAEGQYLVNGTAVRRTDLVELLADLGLGGSMHSIVGQGRVEEILGATPERRRELVEEAAGLGRFKRRRHRAELKLARVTQQVERARDLEAEVRARLRPLALQATAAERAERLRVEAKGIAARIAALDLAAAGDRAAAVEERRAAAALARRLADERLEALLADRARAEEELADAAGRREAATAALYRLRSASERLDLRREAAAAALAETRSRLGELGEAAPLEARLAAARAEAGAADAERVRLLDAATGRNEDEERCVRAELEAVLAGRAAAVRAQREAIAAREEALRRVHELRRAHDRLELRREAAGVLAAALGEELAEAERTPPAVPRVLLERRASETAAEARAAAAARDGVAGRLELARERLAALERSLAEREGLPPAARALAERGHPLALAAARPQAGRERAQAAALGWRAAAVVAPDAQAAFDLLEQARAEGLGSLAVVVGDRARELVERARVVPAAELLQSSSLAVTPEGHGYDPERGELWFVGEAAEALQLELAARRRDLTADVARLEAELPAAVARVDTAAHAAEVAATALAEAPPGPRADPAVLARLVSASQRLAAGLSGPASPWLGSADARAAETAARADDAARAAGEAAEREEELRRALDELAALRERARLDPAVAAAGRRAAAAAEEVRRLEARLDAAVRSDRAALAAVTAGLERLVAVLEGAAATASRFEPALRARADAGGRRTGALAEELRRLGAAEVELRRAAAEAGERAAAAAVERAQAEAEAEDARRRLAEAGAAPAAGDDRDALVARLERIERRREELGRVNPLAREEYERERERLRELEEQRGDVERSLAELERLRAELTDTVERRFAETFAAVERHFAEVASALFPGGEGCLRLTEPDEESGAGVEVELRPAGKRVTRLSLLSGGEKALGAISFLFALFLARPCPFYLLDEVEAALDDANIGRFVSLLRRYADRAQFVVITHQKRTIEAADVLYGVTMATDGVSQVVSRRLPQEDRAALAAG